MSRPRESGRRAPHPRPRWRVLALAAVWLGCGGSESLRPPGAWWVGERAAVETLLDQLAQLGETPLAARARRLRADLPGDCPRLGAQAPDGDLGALEVGARCVAEDDPLTPMLSGETSDSDPAGIVFSWIDGRGRPSTGRIGLDREGLSLSLDWAAAEASGALALLLPGEDGAGADRLASAERLLHLRVRPGEGLDLGSLVPAGSQADRLFRLRGALLGSALLDGTWELALYEPEAAGALPAAALALGVRSPRAATAAAERFVADLASTWSVARSELRLDSARGACLEALNVLPELAPCYAATDTTLVVGWNQRSLERALAGAPTASAESAPAELELDLARIARSDARAVERLVREVGATQPALDWPWRSLAARARRVGDRLRIDARLQLPEPS